MTVTNTSTKTPMSGTLVNEFLDEFPKATRAGAGRAKQRTDVDVALEQLVAEYEQTGRPSRVLKVIDYKRGVQHDAEGNPLPGTEYEVDSKTAAQRAQARVQASRKRGYTKDAGWQLAAVNGELVAKYWGPGNHPVKEAAEENGSA